jgi:predicted deacetylase
MARYIIRMDDACPTMNSKKWDMFEDLLDEIDIKPIVAVIPNNKDNSMHYEEEDKQFWDKVKRWQDKGWNIALHGYDHKYITNKSGLVPINKQSEFSGLSLDIQKEKIKKGWSVFKKYNIKSDIWIAPSHSFDKNTLRTLKEETTISIVSDGVSIFPFNKFDFIWIPQQLWKYKKKNKGIYTICYHPSMMTEKQIIDELSVIKKNHKEFISNIQILKEEFKNKKISFTELVYSKWFFIRRFIIQTIIKVVR